MMHFQKLVYLFSLFILVGCVTYTAPEDTRPTYEEIAHRLPILDAQNGRLIFYHINRGGVGAYPHIKIDDEDVGDALLGSFFLVDIPVGEHEIKAYFNPITGTDVQTINLGSNEIRYIKVIVIQGFVADVEMLQQLPDDGEKGIMKLKFNDNKGKTILLPANH